MRFFQNNTPDFRHLYKAYFGLAYSNLVPLILYDIKGVYLFWSMLMSLLIITPVNLTMTYSSISACRYAPGTSAVATFLCYLGSIIDEMNTNYVATVGEEDSFFV